MKSDKQSFSANKSEIFRLLTIHQSLLTVYGGCSPACRQAGQLVQYLMYFVYILLSDNDNKFYTGITNNIERRLKQHNKGTKSTPSTLNRGPFTLIFAQECNSRENARELEIYFKSGSGRELRDELVT